VKAPDFKLQRIPAECAETPGIFVVLSAPLRRPLSRRRFLGVCMSSSALVVLERGATVPMLGRLRRIVAAQRAAGYALPNALATAAIFSDGADTNSVEKGYHLRVFSDLRFPDAAFPADREALREFTDASAKELMEPFIVAQSTKKQKPLVIRGQSTGDPQKPGDATNRVPPMFLVYRRKHYPHFDRSLQLPQQILRRLRDNPGRVRTIERVEVSMRRMPLGPYLKDAPLNIIASFLPGVPTNQLRQRANELPSTRQIELLEIRFPRPFPGIPRRVVHNVDVEAVVASAASAAVLEGYVDDDPKPIQRLLLRSRNTTAGPRGIGQFVQGHYESLSVVAERLVACTLKYSYMAEDTVVAADRDSARGAEWQLLDTLPFITRFQTWDSAKAELFRHTPANRYLDFTAPEVGTDVLRKLHAKYAHLFQLMQQVFVRMHRARIEGTPFLEATPDRTLRMLRYEPHVFFEMWCMDPNIARLMGHMYPDVPGQQNPSEPDLGVEYDYMVTTAWQEPSQRICYITQKVSQATTPPVLRPQGLAGKQLEGYSAETGKQLHRVGIEWNAPAPDVERFGVYEPPLFDVRRTDTSGSITLTHRVDTAPPGAPLATRIVDVPVQTPLFPPTSEAERATLPAQARLALEFLDVLHNRASDIAITSDHLSAYVAMEQAPFARFFNLPKPQPRFQDWVEVTGTASKTFGYEVRAIDLFGRVSAWSDRTNVSVLHNTAAPEAVALTAVIVDDGSTHADGTPAGLLRVSWRFGGYQAMSGAPVDHFNLRWAPYNASGPAPQQTVRIVYHDVLNREPNTTELGTDTAAIANRTLTPRQLAVRLNSSATNYRLGNPRRYFLWNDLKTTIQYKPPVPFQVVSDAALDAVGTWVVAGEMTSARVTNGESAIAAEEELHGTGQRVLVISTDQCWWGIAPFVASLAPYADSGTLQDILNFRTRGTTYPVVSFEPGEVLRIGIVVPASAAATFITASADRKFQLGMARWQSTMRWTQTVTPEHLPALDEDSEATEDTAAEAEEALIDREVVRLRLTAPLAVEITGRESWLTDHAVVKVTNDVSSWRTELREYAAITVSVDALHFGSVLAGPPATGHKRVLAVDVENGGSAPLMFSAASVAGSEFSIETVPAFGNVEPDSRITIACAFTPTSAGSATGDLLLTLGAETLTIPLRGTGVASVTNEGTHPVAPTARKYLAEVALAQIAHEGPPEFSEPNPIPVFDATLIAAMGAGGASVTFEIEPVEMRRLVINRMSTDGSAGTAQLSTSCGGDVAFVTAEERVVVCEALTRPVAVGNPGEGNRLSFLMRKTPRLPVRGEGPNTTHQCTFHHVYREEIPLATVTGLPDPSADARMAIAVSTHKVPPGGEAVDAESLVSAPERVRLQLPPVPAPTVTPPANVSPTWAEPFRTVYASGQKAVGNESVVQARLTGIANAAGSEIEVLRASLDALRSTLVQRVRSGLTRPPVPPGLSAAAWMRAYHSLPSTAGAAELFQMIAALGVEDRYRFLITLLIHYWHDTANTLQEAFRPVGRVAPGVASFTDQIPVVTEGNFFYALRTISKGTPASNAALCDFKVVIPDRRPPTAPEYLTVGASSPRVLLRWGVARNGDVAEYRVYRSPLAEPVPREADVIASFTPSQAVAQPDTYLAPIEATRARRRLVIRAGTCKPWLPDADVVSVRGVYRSDSFDREQIPLTNQTATNFFQSASGSIHNTSTGALESLVVAPTEGPEPIPVVVVFERRKRIQSTSPLVVQNGSAVLPAGGSVIGIYSQADFDFAASPISAQQASNWLSAQVKTAPHLLGNVPFAEGADVVVVIRDTAGSEWAIEGVKVKNARLVVPFGPRLVDVVGVFDETDTTRSNNLFQGLTRYDTLTRTLSNIAVTNGTKVVVDAIITDYEWTEHMDFGSVKAPPLTSTQNIGGIFEVSRLLGAALPINLLDSSNLLLRGLSREDGQLGFNLPSDIPLQIGFVITTASSQSIRTRDAGRYQVDAGPQSVEAFRYSVVAVRQFPVDAARSASVRSPFAQCVV
jgi:hypothetical protein